MKRCFIDTNVLLYAKDTTAPSKRKQATAWLAALERSGSAVLSAQSLREYYWNMLPGPNSAVVIKALRGELAILDLLVPDELRTDGLARAWDLQDRYRVSFWDALLLASALAANCAIFLSEDLSHGQRIDGMTIVDPFTVAPGDVLA